MEIYPAVDLYQGKVVRLERGDYEKRTVYSEDPAEVARQWVAGGARWLHVVDLEGARSGQVKNLDSLDKILQACSASIEFGGGVRQMEQIEEILQRGVQRVVLGTKALDREFVKNAVQTYGDRLALSLDLRGEEVQLEGWLKAAGKTIFDLFHDFEGSPIACLIVTDIERDGTLEGVNLQKFMRILNASPFPVIVSGGVTTPKDIRELSRLKSKTGKRLEGVILGKALYEKRFSLREALQAAKGG